MTGRHGPRTQGRRRARHRRQPRHRTGGGGSLIREGASVVILGRDLETLAATGAEIVAAGSVAACTADDEAVRRAVTEPTDDLGRLDVVINCAAPRAQPGQVPGLAGLVDDDLLRNVDTKVLGYERVARAAAPYLRRGGGAIVNVSGMKSRSTGSIAGSVRNIAVVALTKNLADDLRPDGITVTCVHPGLTLTESRQGDAEFVATASRNALGRQITAAEVADLITSLPRRGDAWRTVPLSRPTALVPALFGADPSRSVGQFGALGVDNCQTSV